MNDNKMRICLRCKKEKPLTSKFFPRMQKYLDFKPGFARICRDCRKVIHNEQGKQRSKEKNAGKTRKCKYRNCDNRVLTKDLIRYCSPACKENERKAAAELRNEEKQRNGRNISEGIDPKFLVRGKIYGVDYR